jgi:hypothetical protein
MCFSATASFASAAILGVAGIASIKKTQSTNQLAFAAVPLLFAVQQLAEGFVWLSFSGIDQPAWQNGAIKSFLVFALIIWPLWVPLSALLIERNAKRKIIQWLSLGTGLVFACFTSYYMFNYNTGARIQNYHVYYIVDFPNRGSSLVDILYLIPTVVSLLVSSNKGLPALGALIFISFLITKYFYGDYVISVWCFFAAIASGLIYLLASNKIKSFNSGSVPANT